MHLAPSIPHILGREGLQRCGVDLTDLESDLDSGRDLATKRSSEEHGVWCMYGVLGLDIPTHA